MYTEIGLSHYSGPSRDTEKATLVARRAKKVKPVLPSLWMWCYRWLLNITYKDRRTNVSILEQLNTKRELNGLVMKSKLTYFDHMSSSKSTTTKDILQGKIEGKRNRGRTRSFTWIM